MIQTLTKVKLANYQSIPVNIGQLFQVGEEEIVLFKLSNGQIKAVENRSPHPKGGTLVDALVSGSFIYCPCYDWKISLEDGQVQEPDFGKVKSYHIEVEEESVSIMV
jgi:nitrite reductase (NADH) small subunit